MEVDDCRITALLERIQKAEARLSNIEREKSITLADSRSKDPVDRVRNDVLSRNIYSAKFYRVPQDYYDRCLQERAELLMCSISQLCKSILFENTAFTSESSKQGLDPTNSQYYLVVVQYTGNLTLFLEPTYGCVKSCFYSQGECKLFAHFCSRIAQ